MVKQTNLDVKQTTEDVKMVERIQNMTSYLRRVYRRGGTGSRRSLESFVSCIMVLLSASLSNPPTALMEERQEQSNLALGESVSKD